MYHFNQLKYFFRLLTFLGIFSVWNMNKREIQASRGYKLYSLTVLILVTIIYIGSVVLRVIYAFPVGQPTIKYMDTIYYFTDYVLIMLSICQINYFATKKFEKILNVLRCKDKNLVRHQCFVIIFNHLLIFILVFYDCYVRSIQNEMNTLRKVLYLRYFLRYHVQMVVLLLYVLIGAIEVKFRSFNVLLLDCLSKFNIKERTTFFMKVSKERDQDLINVSSYCGVRDMFKLYSEIDDLLRIFNEVFGWINFFVIINSFTVILSSINYIIVELGTSRGANMDWTPLVIVILWTLLGIVSRSSNTLRTIIEIWYTALLFKFYLWFQLFRFVEWCLPSHQKT